MSAPDPIMVNVIGAAVASITGGVVTGVAMMARVKTEIEWLKRSISRMESQHSIMIHSIGSASASAARAEQAVCEAVGSEI